MQINREWIEQQIAELDSQISSLQGARLFAVYVRDTMAAGIGEDAMTLQQFAEAVAGAGASATVVPNGDQEG